MRLTRRRVPRVIRIVILTVAGLVALAVIAAAVFAGVVSHSFDSKRHVVDAFPAGSRPAVATGRASRAINLLLLGTDVDTADPESPQFVGKREADTVMVVHIPADRSKVYVVSILRNSLVDVPGHGSQPINAAYAYGGVKLTVDAVERLLGVRIDHVVDVSLTGIADLTEALRGVTVDNPSPLESDGYTFPVGRQRLEGERALAYLRAGDFKATGDATRVGSQERLFRGVFQQIVDARVLLDPPAIATTVSLFSPYLTTDRGFDSGFVASVGLSLRNIRSHDIKMLRLTQASIGTKDGATVVLIDRSRLAAVGTALRTDRMSSIGD